MNVEYERLFKILKWMTKQKLIIKIMLFNFSHLMKNVLPAAGKSPIKLGSSNLGQTLSSDLSVEDKNLTHGKCSVFWP